MANPFTALANAFGFGGNNAAPAQPAPQPGPVPYNPWPSQKHQLDPMSLGMYGNIMGNMMSPFQNFGPQLQGAMGQIGNINAHNANTQTAYTLANQRAALQMAQLQAAQQMQQSAMENKTNLVKELMQGMQGFAGGQSPWLQPLQQAGTLGQNRQVRDPEEIRNLLQGVRGSGPQPTSPVGTQPFRDPARPHLWGGGTPGQGLTPGPITPGQSPLPPAAVMWGGGAGGIQSNVQPPQPPSGMDVTPQSDFVEGNVDDLMQSTAGPMSYQGGISNLAFNDPSGNQFGGMTVPTPPWAGGSPGSVQTGINQPPGQIWNPQIAESIRSRLGNMASKATPGLTGKYKQLFGDYAGALANKALTGLTRQGTRAEEQHQHRAQVVQMRIKNAMRDLAARIYGSQLSSDYDQNALKLRMMQGLV